MSEIQVTKEQIEELERERLRALVAADMGRVEELHAEDFQLVNPAGRTYTKSEYLGQIASGEIDYRAWEPGDIAALVHAGIAVVRYQAEMEIVLAGEAFPRRRLWHTDVYERRDGRWQVVWSQATAVRES
jgi:hypothetical protein